MVFLVPFWTPRYFNLKGSYALDAVDLEVLSYVGICIPVSLVKRVVVEVSPLVGSINTDVGCLRTP
jgi:hypothetical protein